MHRYLRYFSGQQGKDEHLLGKAPAAKPQARTSAIASDPKAQRPPSACACGGRCPLCQTGRTRQAGNAVENLKLSRPGDTQEREADEMAARVMNQPSGHKADHATSRPHSTNATNAAHPGGLSDIVAQGTKGGGQTLEPAVQTEMEQQLGHDFGSVRIHTDKRAAQSAEALHASAFTRSHDIVFGAGQYAPGSPRGRRLLAHELTHVSQQARTGQPMVQRDVINMEPLVVRSTLRPTGDAVSGLGSLTGQGVNPADMTLTRDPATIAANAPDPARVLPFTTGGWDGLAILTALGQYDTLPGTDSDAIRCVQAVAMAARIPDGPAAVTGYLHAMILTGMLSRPRQQRQRTALNVLQYVIDRIESTRATFGDLMWAQEALHDLFYNDVSGTPETDIRDQLGPAMELGMQLDRRDVWCNSPADVIAQANLLQSGEKLLVNTWRVLFNVAFDQLEDQGITTPEGGTQQVRINGRLVRIRRIRTDVKPAHTDISALRDTRSGHQLLVFRDDTTRTLRLYEPEITNTGQHLETLAADGSNFARYFQDDASIAMYNYIQIIGVLRPFGAGASSSTSP